MKLKSLLSRIWTWINAAGLNLSNLINLSYNYISIPSLEYGINKRARITFWNLNYTYQPVILRDSSLCASCNITSITNASGSWNLTFNVTGFSSYSTGPNAEITVTVTNTLNRSKLVPNDYIRYLARYYNATSGENITSGECNITVDGVTTTMGFHTSPFGYNYTTTYDTTGSHPYVINCSAPHYEPISASGTATITQNTTLFIHNASLEGMYLQAGIVVGDLDSDGSNDIVTVGQNGSYYIKTNIMYNNPFTVHESLIGLIYGTAAISIINSSSEIAIQGLSSAASDIHLIYRR